MKAAATIRSNFGDDHWAKIGAKGGKLGRTGGFYGRPDLARKAGSIGGRRSKRGPIYYICTMEGCNRPHKAKGLCITHYERIRQRNKRKELAAKKAAQDE